MSSLNKLLVSALTGTAFMTLYSYSISRKDKEQYREPELLNHLTNRLDRKINISKRQPTLGYALHYLMGVGFTEGYRRVWKNTSLEPGLASGAVLGFLSGVVGVGIWEATLRIHHNPPTVKKKKYYPHLMIAHAVFGAAVGSQWKLMEKVQ